MPDFSFSLPVPFSRTWSLSLMIGLGAVLAGCSSSPAVKSEEIYEAPASLPGTTLATLRGSSVREGGFLGSEHRGFVSMIDLRFVSEAAKRWDEPLVLSPGMHNITAEYKYSNFTARAYMPFEAKAGANYQLMIKHSHDPAADGRMYNDFWIVNLANGQAVTPVIQRQLSGGKEGTIFYKTK